MFEVVESLQEHRVGRLVLPVQGGMQVIPDVVETPAIVSAEIPTKSFRGQESDWKEAKQALQPLQLETVS